MRADNLASDLLDLISSDIIRTSLIDNNFSYHFLIFSGSSAGAGSGEFHVYRGSRRREYNRLRNIEEQAKKVWSSL